MKNNRLILITIFIIITWQSCKNNKTPTPPETEKPEIILTIAEQAGLREIFLKAEIKDITLPAEIQLLRNDSLMGNYEITSNDTTVIDTGLMPSTDYTYLAYLFKDSILQDSSEILITRTMDTTSHDFTWQTFTFGDGNGSYLRDVFIINENDIWAVGNIQVLDSTGTRYIPYNAVHWNGQEWELKKLMVKHPSWTEPHPISLDGVFAFSSTDIWFASGNVFHYDSASYNQSGLLTSYFLWDMDVLNNEDGSATKIWGSNSNDLLFVGSKGVVIHYNGSVWHRLESGTELRINDIWGAKNAATGETEIICVASNKFYNEGNALFSIKDNHVNNLSTAGLSWSLSSVWFIPGKLYYVVGAGVYLSKAPGSNWIPDFSLPAIYTDCIRGSSLADIVVCGYRGMLSHFNGSTWKHYLDNELPSINGRYYSCDIKDNTIVTVGFNFAQPFIALGTRSN